MPHGFKIMKVRISYTFKRLDKFNKLSGHSWPEYIPLKQVAVVWNGIKTICNSEKTALKVKAEAEAFNKKFPVTMPRSAREIAKCKYLNLDIKG